MRLIVIIFLLLPFALAGQNLLPVSANISGKRLYGFSNEKGKILINYSFDTIFRPFRNNIAVVGKNGYAGAVNNKGKEVIPVGFMEVGEIMGKLVPVKNNLGLWGFYSTDGKLLLPCSYNNFRLTAKGRLIVQQNGKWGMISSNGEEIVKPQYNSIQYLDGKNFRVQKINSWQVKNRKGQTIGNVEFDSLFPGTGIVFRYSLIGNYGLTDNTGKIIAEPKYEYLGSFKNGIAVCAINNKFGAIDSTGKLVAEIKYDEAFTDGSFVYVKSNNLWGALDKSGNLVLPIKYLEIKYSKDNFFCINENGKWGYCSKTGEKISACIYGKVQPFTGDYAEVINERGQRLVIDKNGETLIQPEEMMFFDSGVLRLEQLNKKVWVVNKDRYEAFEKVNEELIRVKLKGKYGIINTRGKEVVSVKYDYVSSPSEEGNYIVAIGNKWGVLADNKYIHGPTTKYEQVFPFVNGMARMIKKGKYGFIDAEGNVWISPQYEETGEFSEGMLALKINGKWGFVDKDEAIRVQPYYDKVFPFKNGCALVYANGKWNLVNKEGKELHAEGFDNIVSTASGRYILERGTRRGMAGIDGQEILDVKYGVIRDLNNGTVMVRKDGQWGVLDYNENFIIPIENDFLIYDEERDLYFCGKKGRPDVIMFK
ncbi:MAG: WG repeat-containing protein [Cytophagaceae bacterium]